MMNIEEAINIDAYGKYKVVTVYEYRGFVREYKTAHRIYPEWQSAWSSIGDSDQYFYIDCCC